MPKITDNLENFKLAGNYGFSATRIADLGATEYTLVTLVVDESGSVSSFKNEIVNCIKEVVNACKYSPRSDNLMIRLVAFNGSLREVHGFKLLANCNPDDYDSAIQPTGSTALFDAAINSIDATSAYAKTLSNNEFSANGIVIVITDGEDNCSSASSSGLSDCFNRIKKEESLESLVSILVGVNTSGSSYLKNVSQAGFTQYIEIGSANSKTLAKLAEFVSKSISNQSSALGTGGPSQVISASF
jgi:uncharacterized protein YegL